MNVTAGIGVLGQASLMIGEEMFGEVTAVAAGGLRRAHEHLQYGRPIPLGLGLRLHRPQDTYAIFFLLGALLYVIPGTGTWAAMLLFACSASS